MAVPMHPHVPGNPPDDAERVGAKRNREGVESIWQSAEFFRRAFDESPIGQALVSLDHRFYRVNDALCEFTGYSREELTTLDFKSITHPEELGRDVEAVRRLASGDIDYYHTDKRYVRKDGKAVWGHLSLRMMRDAEGNPLCFLPMVEDITEPKEAEAQLLRLLQAVEASGEAIFMTDPDGTVSYVNPEFTRLYGYPASDVVGKVTPRILKSGTLKPEHYEAFWQRILKGQVISGTFTNKTRDGNLIEIEGSVNPILDDQHNLIGYLAIQRDITARKQAEAAVRESEERYRAVAETAEDSIFILDPEGRFEFMNAYAAREVGGRPEQFVGKHLSEVFPPELAGQQLATVQRIIATGTPVLVEVPTPLLRGTRWMHTWLTPLRREDGGVRGVLGISRDMTERREHEEVLRKREEWFRTLIENATDIVTVLSSSGMIDYMSPSVRRVLGYAPDDLVGQQVFTFIHPDDIEETADAIGRVVAHPGEVVSKELRFRDKAGAWRYLEAAGRFVTDSSGSGRIVVNSRDIAERKEAEAALTRNLAERRALEDQFRQAQKMEAVGRLAGGVAHDFNNLLTAILGYSDLLRDQLPPEAPGRQDVEEIRLAADRAAGLTRQLLAFSRKQVLQPSELDLNDVVGGTGNMLRRLLGEDVELVIVGAADLWPVRADRGQIEQVVMNLAVNARDAMPDGGQLTIETANADLRHARVLDRHAVEPGRYVTLSVSDTGTGMDAETQRHLFEPFFTTKERGKGTGLGLATVYGIVKQSGGYIWADSEVGRGSRFTIYLPRVDASTEAHLEDALVAGSVTGHETVLIAEDEAAVRNLVCTVLRQRGYTVLAASNGDEALQIAQDHPARIDLLITDIVMPGMNGRQLVERLTRAHPHLKIVYSSGYTDSANVTDDLRAGGATFLHKPFTRDGLERAVRWQLDNPPERSS